MTPLTEPELLTFKKNFIEPETIEEGSRLNYNYYRFVIEFPQAVPYQELTDEEILTLADKAGTFDFLYSPEEDIYDSSDGTPV